MVIISSEMLSSTRDCVLIVMNRAIKKDTYVLHLSVLIVNLYQKHLFLTVNALCFTIYLEEK